VPVASTTARLYDALYVGRGKDYQAESELVRGLIEAERPGARTLLDVGCGTGQHMARLSKHYDVEGLDLDAGMLEVARERLGPDAALHKGDMRDFDLGRRFDAVVSLFSVIGYVRSLRGLRRVVAAMARHLAPDGVLIVEPWLVPTAYKAGVVASDFVSAPELRIARMSVSKRLRRLSIMEMDWLVGTPYGVDRLRERLVLGLFTDEEYQAAFRAAGLAVRRDADLLPEGRCVYVARPAG
jgi:SAM-dependent methyltransferase